MNTKKILQCGVLFSAGCAAAVMGVRSAKAASVLYVANYGNGTISEIGPTGSVSTLASGLYGPYGLAPGANGSLLFVANGATNAGLTYNSGGSYSIDAISAGGGASTTASIPVGTEGPVINDYAYNAAQPQALTVDSAGNLYVALYGGDIDEITPKGTPTTVADIGVNQLPDGLAFGPNGNLYVANFLTNSIDEVDTSSETVTPFVSLSSAPGPGGLAFDSSGNLYVADWTSNEVEKINSDGSVSPFASFSSGSEPASLAFGSDGNLYVTLYGDKAVEKVTPSGAVSLFASGLDGPAGIVAMPAPIPASFGLVGIGSLALIGGLALRRRMAAKLR
ncbi:MAG: virginiamycin B lyase family protein [Phycisphaerae bacterium]